MPTLFLELNPDRLVVGAARAEAALKGVQDRSSAVGRNLESAALSNRAYTLSVDSMSGELRRVPVAMAAVTTATQANTLATVASAAAQRALSVATSVGSRVMSGFLRTIAITPLVALATAATAAVLELGKMAIGFSDNSEAAKKYATEMERAKAATDAFNRAVAASEQEAIASDRLTAVGDTAGALDARAKRLEAIKTAYADIARLDKGTGVTAEAFTKFGLPVPDASEGQAQAGTGWKSRFAPPTVVYSIESAAAAYKKYIDASQAANDKDLDGVKASKARSEALRTLASDLAALYTKASSPFQRESAASDLIGKAGLQGTGAESAAKSAMSAYEQWSASVRLLGTSFRDAAAERSKLEAGAADKAASKATANEQLLSAIEANEAASRQSQMGSQAYSKEQNVQNIKALAESAGMSAEQIQRLGNEASASIDGINAKAAADKSAAAATQKAQAEYERSASGFAGNFNSAGTEMILHMDNLGSAFDVLAANVASQVVSKAIEPAANAAGSALTTYFSTSAASAKGNVFAASGMVHQFAYGDVIDRRTPFTYGGGRRGEMGEAGTEGILPLRRGPSGRLGVEVTGGGARGQSVQITQHFHGVRDATGVRRSGKQSANMLSRTMEPR